jgi:hemolysin activation/secretion protein
LAGIGKPGQNEWRFNVFTDVGWLAIHDALPEQWPNSGLWSVGAGTRARMLGQLGGEVELGVPLRTQGNTEKFHPRIQFKLSGEF